MPMAITSVNMALQRSPVSRSDVVIFYLGIVFFASGTLMYCLSVRTGQRAGGESPTSSKACTVVTLRVTVSAIER